MMISCLMPTYGRLPRHQWCLEEAVESYIRNAAELPAEVDSELIICNDAPNQIIRLNEPRPDVRVFNLSKRFDSLGEKLNWMIEQSTAELVCRWDDDDINLSHGLKWRYEKMMANDLDAISPKRFFAVNGEKMSFGFGSFAQIMVKKAAHHAIGGYTHVSFAEDQSYESRLDTAGFKLSRFPIDYREAYYLYVYGQGCSHLGGFGNNSGWDRIGQYKLEPGTYVLKPQWYQNYNSRVEQAREDYRVKCENKKKNPA